jgi:hypothetical protein
VDVDSLGVPMSPELVNERMRALIAHGLISTERTHPHRTHAPAFLGTGCSKTKPLFYCGQAVRTLRSSLPVNWQYTEGMGIVSLGVCSFCGDETMGDGRPMAHIAQSWAHRNAQRDHTPRDTIPRPSSKQIKQSQHDKHSPSSDYLESRELSRCIESSGRNGW